MKTDLNIDSKVPQDCVQKFFSGKLNPYCLRIGNNSAIIHDRRSTGVYDSPQMITGVSLKNSIRQASN